MPKLVSETTVQEISAGRGRLKSPRAAAIAGILFAILFSISLGIIRYTLPNSIGNQQATAEISANAGLLGLALTLVPFSGIAFLWFIGVMRDRLGSLEDQLVSTVLFGSGLLFLGMIFVSAAIAGVVIATFDVSSNLKIQDDVVNFGRMISFTITNVYAVRMAGVFMMSSGTLWIRTGVMPRWLALFTYGLALILLFLPGLSLWTTMAFPFWVFVISIFILVRRPLSVTDKSQQVESGSGEEH